MPKLVQKKPSTDGSLYPLEVHKEVHRWKSLATELLDALREIRSLSPDKYSRLRASQAIKHFEETK